MSNPSRVKRTHESDQPPPIALTEAPAISLPGTVYMKKNCLNRAWPYRLGQRASVATRNGALHRLAIFRE